MLPGDPMLRVFAEAVRAQIRRELAAERDEAEGLRAVVVPKLRTTVAELVERVVREGIAL